LSIGFNRPRDLAATVATWDDLFATVNPNLVVAEHSPIACLAARGRYPLIVAGTGFTAPPAEMRLFPPFRAGIQPPAIHQRLLDSVNSLLTSRGQPTISHLPELLAGDRRAVFTLPHLDPYGPLRRDKLLGPYHGRITPRPSPAERSVYLYSRASEGRLYDMVEVLLGLDVEITAFITGPDSIARRLLENRGAMVFDRPPDLAQALGQANIAISHGGAGVVGAALMLGRAQVIAPIHVESEVTAARVEAAGSAMVVEPFAKDNFRKAVETVLQVRMFHEHAAEIAAEIARLDLPADPLDDVAGLCEELL
jgi:UDP:flavonoid glycosyltransferase YjiC (YdhE family)